MSFPTDPSEEAVDAALRAAWVSLENRETRKQAITVALRAAYAVEARNATAEEENR